MVTLVIGSTDVNDSVRNELVKMIPELKEYAKRAVAKAKGRRS